MSVLAQAALDYAASGLYVFPLQPRGKTPLTPHGLEDATTDSLTIETWWARWPDANIGIRTGDVVVVDEDRLGALDELAADHDMPVTRVARTSSGRHFYFSQPEGQRIRNTAGKLAAGIDTRGDGGYVVAPPSVHPSGATYAWEDEHDPAPLPAWIAERLAKPERKQSEPFLGRSTPYGQRALESELAAVALAHEGTRNETLNKAAFALGQLVAGGEVDSFDAQRSLEAAAQACGLPESEATATIRSGFNDGLAEPRRAPENGRQATSPVRIVEEAPAPVIGDWVIDAAELLSEPDPGPTPWLVDGLIVDGAIVAAVGRWKTTKSYGLLDLCISIATGEPAFGEHEIPNPGPVIFINEESGRAALWRRLDSLCRGRGIDPERLRGKLLLGANARIKLDAAPWQEELVALGNKVEPRLFVFDPLARMKAAAREENQQTEMAPLIEFMRLLREETGSGVCFVHHQGHQGEQMRGSSDLESAWETRLTWKRDGRSPNVSITSDHREAESIEPITYQIRWDSDTRTMRFALVRKDGIPALSERIVAQLEAHDEDGMTTDEVRAAVNVRRTDVVRTLETMEVAGTAYRTPSVRPDGMGRRVTRQVWKAGNHTLPSVVTHRPEGPDGVSPGHASRDIPSHRPTSLEVGGTDGESDGPSDELSTDDGIPF